MGISSVSYYYSRCKSSFDSTTQEKKYYEKIHAAGEDRYSYTFYTDSVRIKKASSESILQYDTAELYEENKQQLMVVFQFGRYIQIDKKQCDEEKLDFIRNIVPKENQKQTEKKIFKKFLLRFSVLIAAAIGYAVIIGLYAYINAHY